WIMLLALSLLISAAITVNKSLLRSKGGLVALACTVYQFEILAEFTMQAFRAIPHNLQSTTTLWPVGGKSCDDHMPTLSDGMSDSIYIALAISGLRQEVEHRTIMPDVIGLMG